MVKAKETTTEATEATAQTFSQEMEQALIDRSELTRAEKIKMREQKLKAIKFLEIPYIQSKKLVGAKFDVVDAVRKTIDGEVNVAFVLVLREDAAGYKAGDKVSASKALNSFTEAYLDYFESFDADETPEPFAGYTFVELSEGGQAGNKPVVLRKQ